MKVLIDADGCPVTYITVNEAKKRKTEVLVFSDTSHIFSINGVENITVDKGADSADFAIANKAEKGDLVITQDYGLASMCLAKGAYALRQDGVFYTEDNIDFLLAGRYEAKKALRSGAKIKGPKKRTGEEDKAFKEALITFLDKYIREGTE